MRAAAAAELVDDELVRTAFHEAGHAVAAFQLAGNRGIHGAVTIVPGRAWIGLASVDGVRARARDWRLRPEAPVAVAMWPAPVRRQLETSIIVSLAGGQAEKLAAKRVRRPGEWFWEHEQSLEPPSRPRSPAGDVRLPPREARELARAAAAETWRSDLELAYEDAELLAGGDLGRAELLVRYFDLETQALLAAYPAPRMLARLADELLEHRTLPAAHARHILKEAAR